jgi:hypothetical protein
LSYGAAILMLAWIYTKVTIHMPASTSKAGRKRQDVDRG